MGRRGPGGWIHAVLAIAAILGGGFALRAADHVDSPAAAADPAADLTNLFAWTSPDASKLNLVLNVYAAAPASAKFSEGVLYMFHVGAQPAYGAPAAAETPVVCAFDAAQTVSCWVGTGDYVSGDASREAGLTSASGKVRVFAGLRDDPFFFNGDGFRATVAAVGAAAPSAIFDSAGCPAFGATTAAGLMSQLGLRGDRTAARNDFAGTKVLALVLQIDKTLFTAGGGVLGVWASTHRRRS